MRTNAERKKMQPTRDGPSAASRSGATVSGNVPNSVMLSMMGGDRPSGSSIDELGERIRSRLPSVQQRPQAQIPRAENEADRLSAAVNAGTPETVKAVMGQRMGADFSGVRFHTGIAAAAKADAMGARAYTSGADVYFGSGGFDPSVAAHELVHTAQQGMVDSGVATMSTPMGGVQMEPNAFTRFFQRIWRRTGGAIKRHRHETQEELHRAMEVREDGTRRWDNLTPEQQKFFTDKNPRIYKKYMTNQANREKIAARVQKQRDMAASTGGFLDRLREENGDTTTSLGDMRTEDPQLQVYRGKSGLEKAIDYAANDFSPLKKAKDKVDNMLELTGGRQTAPMSPETLQLQQQNPPEEEDDSEEILKEIIDKGDELHGALNDAGVIDTGPLGEIKDLSTGMSKAIGNTQKAVDARHNRQAMTAMKKELRGEKTRAEMTPHERLYGDMASHSSMAARAKEIKHGGKAAEGGARAVGAILGMAGLEPADKAVKAVGVATRWGTDTAARHQKDRMEHKIADQTHNINSRTIKQYMQEHNIPYTVDNYSEVKRAMVRSRGAQTGFRKEVAAFETGKRAQRVAADAKAGDPDALRIVRQHGIAPDAEGNFDEKQIASQAFGINKTWGEVAGKQLPLAAMEAENLRSREALAAQQAAQTPAPAQPQQDASGSESGSSSGHRKHRRRHRHHHHAAPAETVVMPEVTMDDPDIGWLQGEPTSGSGSGSDSGHRKHRRHHHHHHAASAETVVMPEVTMDDPDIGWLQGEPTSGSESGSDSGHKKHRRHRHSS